MGYIAEYKGTKFVISHSFGVGAVPRPQPKPEILTPAHSWAKDWPIRQERYVSAGQHYQPYDLEDFV